MTKAQARKVYAITIAVIALILALAIFLFVRFMRPTTSLYDYALTLGSDELFISADHKIYRIHTQKEAVGGRLYLQYERSVEDLNFRSSFGIEPMDRLSPYEFASIYSHSEVYVRGDGSIWVLEDGFTSQSKPICIRPYFIKTESSAPTSEHPIELTDLYFFPVPSLRYQSDVIGAQNPYTTLSVQLEDGYFYRLGKPFDPHYTIDLQLPYENRTKHIPEGQYCLAVYDSVDGEEVTLAAQEFTLSWEGSYCRITGSKG